MADRFARTRAALAAFDAGEAEADAVREAFALDTADVNRRDQAYLITPDGAHSEWLRALVAADQATPVPSGQLNLFASGVR